jgi:hypothetical protein
MSALAYLLLRHIEIAVDGRSGNSANSARICV